MKMRRPKKQALDQEREIKQEKICAEQSTNIRYE